MANKYKGEINFDADGKSYTLRLSFNALCALESKTGATFNTIVGAMGDPSRMNFTHLRALLWAALQHYHRPMSIDAAGDLVDAIGVTEAVRLIGEAVALAFPVQEPDGRPLANLPGNGMQTNKSEVGAP